jgi:hypothetical protein
MGGTNTTVASRPLVSSTRYALRRLRMGVPCRSWAAPLAAVPLAAAAALALRFEEPADALNDNPRLAGPGARNDDDRTVAPFDDAPLGAGQRSRHRRSFHIDSPRRVSALKWVVQLQALTKVDPARSRPLRSDTRPSIWIRYLDPLALIPTKRPCQLWWHDQNEMVLCPRRAHWAVIAPIVRSSRLAREATSAPRGEAPSIGTARTSRCTPGPPTFRSLPGMSYIATLPELVAELGTPVFVGLVQRTFPDHLFVLRLRRVDELRVDHRLTKAHAGKTRVLTDDD